MLKELLSFETQVILSFLTAFGLCYFMIPPITRLAKDKGLVAIPNQRDSHHIPIPTIGGVAIYFAFILSTLIFAGIANEPFLPYMTASSLIIFMIGLNDDVYVISPRRKLFFQMIATVIVVVMADIRITNFQGVFGIFEIPYWFSILFSIFVFVSVTNAVNLMDGIDGLAASMGIIACFGFGVFFWQMEKYGATIVCVSMIGALIAFLRFNFATINKKIFMGDTGSLTIGFIVAGIALRFNEINLVAPVALKINVSPVVSVGFLAIPIFDTLRVMVFRILRKKSPFKADKTHIHHILLTKGYTHHQATVVISTFSLMLVFLIYSIHDKVSGYALLSILLGAVITFYLFPFTHIYKRVRSSIQYRLKKNRK